MLEKANVPTSVPTMLEKASQKQFLPQSQGKIDPVPSALAADGKGEEVASADENRERGIVKNSTGFNDCDETPPEKDDACERSSVDDERLRRRLRRENVETRNADMRAVLVAMRDIQGGLPEVAIVDEDHKIIYINNK